MRKVFSYFKSSVSVNNKIIIPIIAAIAIAIAVTVVINNQTPAIPDVADSFDKGLNVTNSSKVQKKIDDIKKAAQENEYSPKERKWLVSGPFQIDRDEYILGEKIFLRAGPLGYDEKGQVVLLRPSNDTHYSVYFTLPFDGSERSSFNYYFEPKLSKINKYCTVDDFVGDWRMIFRGTDYPNLEFKITDQIIPGEEESYQPKC